MACVCAVMACVCAVRACVCFSGVGNFFFFKRGFELDFVRACVCSLSVSFVLACVCICLSLCSWCTWNHCLCCWKDAPSTTSNDDDTSQWDRALKILAVYPPHPFPCLGCHLCFILCRCISKTLDVCWGIETTGARETELKTRQFHVLNLWYYFSFFFFMLK